MYIVIFVLCPECQINQTNPFDVFILGYIFKWQRGMNLEEKPRSTKTDQFLKTFQGQVFRNIKKCKFFFLMRQYLTVERYHAQTAICPQNFAILFYKSRGVGGFKGYLKLFQKFINFDGPGRFLNWSILCLLFWSLILFLKRELIRFASGPFAEKQPQANETQMSFLEGRHTKLWCGERGKVWLMGGWEWLLDTYLVAKPSSYTVANS